MELWFTEKQNSFLHLSIRVNEILEKKTTPYQEIVVLETEVFGRTLVLDGFIQLTRLDEFIYHEMIVHVPLVAHGQPEKVLIVGGGDGGSVREALRHPTVKSVTLVEIDQEVVETSRRYFPEISSSLTDSRVEVICEDGASYIKEQVNNYDVIIIDSTEPVGPAQNLFSYEFFRDASKALQNNGILVAQTESPFHNADLVSQSYEYIKNLFPETGIYLAPVPSYPGGYWSFTIGSKEKDPCKAKESQIDLPLKECQYYSPEIHNSAFVLPPFLEKKLVKDNEESAT